jgi:hypothetical protein
MSSIDERDQRSRFGRQRLEPSSDEPPVTAPVTALGAFEAAGRFVDDLLETADSFKWKPIEGTPLFCMPNPNEDIDRLSRKYDRETMSGLMSVVELVESQNGRPEHETLHRSLHVFLGWLDAALRTVLRCRWVTIGYIPQGGSAPRDGMRAVRTRLRLRQVRGPNQEVPHVQDQLHDVAAFFPLKLRNRGALLEAARLF